MKKNLLYFICLSLFIISCRENIVEFDVVDRTGKLYINSNPIGADIYFDNSSTGKTTPDSLTSLQPGNYLIRVSKIGYGSKTVNVDISAGQKKYINIELIF